MRSCEIFIPDGSIAYYEALITSRNEVMHSSKNQMVEEKTKLVLEGARKLLKCLGISDTEYYKEAIQELQDLEENDFVIKYQPEEYKQIVAKVLEAKDIAAEIHNAIDADHQCKSQSKCLQEMLERISGTSSTEKKVWSLNQLNINPL
ncbi:uncharacterized protein LOC123537014 [Mercenaria mercenaria]|uniref:uncharacterized protein LOC123537014 n=1 Tax=Mercenaria mercenaria TaxID=6596 RepID=UPI00234EB90A|nr:uncharacterized protein LOC123537014 [Mercenaria mercenaria]